MQSVQACTKKESIYPLVRTLKRENSLYFSHKHAKTILFLFFSAGWPYREVKPWNACPCVCSHPFRCSAEQDWVILFPPVIEIIFFFLLVCFSSQISLVVARVREYARKTWKYVWMIPQKWSLLPKHPRFGGAQSSLNKERITIK